MFGQSSLVPTATSVSVLKHTKMFLISICASISLYQLYIFAIPIIYILLLVVVVVVCFCFFFS